MDRADVVRKTDDLELPECLPGHSPSITLPPPYYHCAATLRMVVVVAAAGCGIGCCWERRTRVIIIINCHGGCCWCWCSSESLSLWLWRILLLYITLTLSQSRVEPLFPTIWVYLVRVYAICISCTRATCCRCRCRCRFFCMLLWLVLIQAERASSEQRAGSGSSFSWAKKKKQHRPTEATSWPQWRACCSSRAATAADAYLKLVLVNPSSVPASSIPSIWSLPPQTNYLFFLFLGCPSGNRKLPTMTTNNCVFIKTNTK